MLELLSGEGGLVDAVWDGRGSGISRRTSPPDEHVSI